MANDSVEAVLRTRHGLGTTDDAQRIRSKRLRVRVIEPGDWNGAYLTLEVDVSARTLKARPAPQVALRNTGDSKWQWFLEKQLDATPEVERYRQNGEAMLAAPRVDATYRRLVDKVRSLGIAKNFGRPETHHDLVGTWIDSAIDDVILRAVGKIAFNYFAYAAGAEFALRADFDQFRKYVRFGTKPPMLPVAISKRPMLAGDDQFYRQTNGHIVGLDWNQEGTGIGCLVSLFNHLSYHALLCVQYSGLVYCPIRTGHHFDPQSRSVTRLR